MIIQSYNDVCAKIKALEIWIDSLNRDIKYYAGLLFDAAPHDISGIGYDGMPRGSRNDMGLDRIIEALHKCESHLYLAEEEMKCKLKTKQDIETVLSEMKGLEYRVFYYRVVKGLTQEKTAEELDRSDRTIRNIEKRIKISGRFPVTIVK